MAMEKNKTMTEILSRNMLDKSSEFSEIKEWFKLAQTNKQSHDTIMNDKTNFSKRMNFHKDIDSFMKEQHADNWTCETSYHYDEANFRYPTYKCQSTLTHPIMTFKGHPGFELEELYPGL